MAVATTTTATTAQPPSPLPEPEQASPSQLDADPNVQSAVRFLQDPRVRNSPVESQIRFLKGKSMSDAQIKHAFSKVGRPVTPEKVASVRAPVRMNSSFADQTAANGPSHAMSTQLKSHPQFPVAPPPQPQYSQTLFPRTPLPLPEEPQTKGVDWRDVVIGTGAAILAGVAGYKLFNRYSPYEIRRKSDKKPSRTLRGPYSGRHRPNNGYSDSETDGSSFPPLTLQARPLPPPPPTDPAALGPDAAAATTAAAPGAEAGELKKLQTELDETKEALTNERKKCADLAVSSAKIRAEKQQLSRANDRLTQQVDALKKDVEKLEEEKATAAGGGRLTATEEEPPRAFYPSLTKEAEVARASTAAVSPVVEAPGTTATPAAPAPAPAAPTPAAAVPFAATTAAAVSMSPAAELPPAPSTALPATEPTVEVAPTPAPTTSAAEAAPTAVPEPTPVPVPAPAADAAVPLNLAAAVPPAFLTPDPINPADASVAPPN
ncbi:peroxin 14 putative (PEX14) [Leptomonas seymouri]|uniref:Peroxisomal membrane protein PEX14 n=1 Tax=Leptomonas seymouri TaxID=5684 RepID=A0A0N1PA53_LEPSE|nr:peroxin 14 putative (PEX14) [Leptomonas seymouri]|eukprot:KPI82980.1 peroxin 14 putative (PEX14) [Leptomonas seymouri]